MDILVLGNGFDLAHGLPTKYEDFLKFVEVIRQVINIWDNEQLDKIDWKNMPMQIQELVKYNMGIKSANLFYQRETWKELLNNNIWIDYFLQCEMYQKENWIDFESEISRIIQSIDQDMKQYGVGINSIVQEITEPFFAEFFLNDLKSGSQEREVENERDKIEKDQEDYLFDPLKKEITYGQLIFRFEQDLNKLIRALEIYLSDYVEKITCNVLSPDIEEVTMKVDYSNIASSFCKILNFNYTNICEKIYAEGKVFDVDYIHGKAYINNIVDTNNMVLGIDEYLPDSRKNRDIEFIAFKKYYQRIYKENGCKYKEWLDEIRRVNYEYEERIRECEMELERYTGHSTKRFELKQFLDKEKQNAPIHNLYIFGHSLDITDRDILREFILCNAVYTTIFYHNKKDLGRKIANLVKVIGQDELIKRTGGSMKTIEFKKQKDMVRTKDV